MIDILTMLSALAYVVEVVCSHQPSGENTVVDLCDSCLNIAKAVELSPDHTLATAQKDMLKGN